jgi:hypothetical protein
VKRLALAVAVCVTLTGCGWGGILGEAFKDYKDAAVCLQHPRYGRVCVTVDGRVFYETILPPPAEKPAVDEWAKAEAKAGNGTPVPAPAK